MLKLYVIKKQITILISSNKLIVKTEIFVFLYILQVILKKDL